MRLFFSVFFDIWLYLLKGRFEVLEFSVKMERSRERKYCNCEWRRNRIGKD